MYFQTKLSVSVFPRTEFVMPREKAVTKFSIKIFQPSHAFIKLCNNCFRCIIRLIAF